jgi:hypothetical protein
MRDMISFTFSKVSDTLKIIYYSRSWQIKGSHRFFDTLFIEEWGLFLFSLNLGRLCDCFDQ